MNRVCECRARFAFEDVSRAAGRAVAETERRKALCLALNDAVNRLLRPGLEIAGHLLGDASAVEGAVAALDDVALIALPVSSVYTLLSGLAELGRVHLRAQQQGELRARRLGFATALGNALDDPRVGRRELEAEAVRSRHVQHFAGLARAAASVPIREKSRREYAALAAAYLDGTELAIGIVERLDRAERRELAAQLARNLDGESSRARLFSFLSIEGD